MHHPTKHSTSRTTLYPAIKPDLSQSSSEVLKLNISHTLQSKNEGSCEDFCMLWFYSKYSSLVRSRWQSSATVTKKKNKSIDLKSYSPHRSSLFLLSSLLINTDNSLNRSSYKQISYLLLNLFPIIQQSLYYNICSDPPSLSSSKPCQLLNIRTVQIFCLQFGPKMFDVKNLFS